MQSLLLENEPVLMDAVTLAHVERQAECFEQIKSQLLEHYLGQYVWLVDGEVLDSDLNFSALFDRVVKQVGDSPIFIRQVVAQRALPKVRSAVIR